MPWLHWLTQYTICSSVYVLHCDLHRLTNHIMRWLTDTKTQYYHAYLHISANITLFFLCVYHSSTIVGACTTIFMFRMFFNVLFILTFWMCQDTTMLCCICTTVISHLFLIYTMVVIWYIHIHVWLLILQLMYLASYFVYAYLIFIYLISTIVILLCFFGGGGLCTMVILWFYIYLFNGITMLFYTMRICVYTMVIMFLYYHGNTIIFFYKYNGNFTMLF